MKVRNCCKTCEWWRPKDAYTRGLCQFHAPKPITWVVAEEQEIERPVVLAVWPTTKPNDACGDWSWIMDTEDNG